MLEGRGAHQLLAVEERGRKKGLEGNREREGCWELFLPLLAMLLLLAVTWPHWKIHPPPAGTRSTFSWIRWLEQ